MNVPPHDAQPTSEVSLAQEPTPAMDQQVRDAVGRLTWGYQSAATVLAAGVHVNALRAALVQLGRDADAEIKAAIGDAGLNDTSTSSTS